MTNACKKLKQGYNPLPKVIDATKKFIVIRPVFARK